MISLLASQYIQAADKPANENLFLMTGQLTEIQPLRLQFLKGEQELSDNSREMVRQWAARVSRYHIPVYIHSFATLPTGIRNMTEDMARHQAVRVAFSRGLHAKNILEQSGIDKNRLILRAMNNSRFQGRPLAKLQVTSQVKSQVGDNITLTIRRDPGEELYSEKQNPDSY